MTTRRRQLRALDYLAIWKELEGKAKPEKKAENIASIVYSRELEDGCKLFIDKSDGTPFFATVDGEVFSLSEKNSDAHARIAAYLYAKYCLSSKFKWSDHAISVLRARALQSNVYREGRRFVSFDQENMKLYLTRWNGRVRVVDGVPLEGITAPILQGPIDEHAIPPEEEILFGMEDLPHEDPLDEIPFAFDHVPVTDTSGPTNVAVHPLDEIANAEEVFFYDDDDGVDVREPVIGPHGQLLDVFTDATFASDTLGGMTPEQQRMLLIIWCFAVAFPDLVRTKPILVFEGAPGSGKCLGLEVPVLKYDGTIIAAQDVRKNDLLMGPDSKPRRVLSTTRGYGPMYRIDPIKGDSWTCNDQHILTLVRNDRKHNGEIYDVSIQAFLGLGNYARNRSKLFQPETGVVFPKRAAPPISPYFLGVWFGDGSKGLTNKTELRSVHVTKPDPEIETICREVATSWGLHVNCTWNDCPTWRLVNVRGAGNPLLDALRNLLSPQLTVPDCILYGSQKTRQEFLAGFLDTDGTLACGYYEIVQKRGDYADAVAFIARSLGLRVTRTIKFVDGTPYHRLSILGHIDRLPLRIPRKKPKKRQQIKNALRTGFDVVAIGNADYAGFELDGDGRFLLGDFTVTHNSTLAIMLQAIIHGQETGLMIDQDGAKDFPIQLLKNPIALFDNVDSYIDWIPDAICAYTTVGVWKRRKLFTDAVDIQIAPKSFPVIASKNPASFRREDVADRLIILRLERRYGAFKPLSNLMNEIKLRRPYLFGEYLYWCNEIVAAYHSGIWGHYENFKLRQADFAQFGLLVAYVLKWNEDDVLAAFDALTREQRAHAVEHDEIVTILRGWANWGHASKKFMSAHAIFRDVVSYAIGNQGIQERDLKFNAVSLGSRLRSGSLGDHFQIDEKIDKNSGQHLYLILPKDHGTKDGGRPSLDIMDGGLVDGATEGGDTFNDPSQSNAVSIAVDFNQKKNP